jgi:hypothetical protein
MSCEVIMKKFSMTIQINSREEALRVFDSFLSTIEKDFKTIFGNLTFAFEDIISTPHKEQKGT